MAEEKIREQNATYESIVKKIIELRKQEKNAILEDDISKVSEISSEIARYKEILKNKYKTLINYDTDKIEDKKQREIVEKEKETLIANAAYIFGSSDKPTFKHRNVVMRVFKEKKLNKKVASVIAAGTLVASLLGGLTFAGFHHKNKKDSIANNTTTQEESTTENLPTYDYEDDYNDYSVEEPTITNEPTTEEQKVTESKPVSNISTQSSSTKSVKKSNDKGTTFTEEPEITGEKIKTKKKTKKKKTTKKVTTKKKTKKKKTTTNAIVDKNKNTENSNKSYVDPSTGNKVTETVEVDPVTGEKTTTTIIEEPKVDYDYNAPIDADKKDEIYYDENGNQKTEQEAHDSIENSEKNNEQNQETTEDKNNQETTTEDKSNQETTDDKNNTNNNIDSTEDDEIYYDVNGNPTTKEEADKSFSEQEKTMAIQKLKAAKAKLISIKNNQVENAKTLTKSL